jgi:hypothetical protein
MPEKSVRISIPALERLRVYQAKIQAKTLHDAVRALVNLPYATMPPTKPPTHAAIPLNQETHGELSESAAKHHRTLSGELFFLLTENE